ncbi:MAG: helix-turn-helix transcriptional regulator [Siphonobacter sp.]
MSDKEKILYLLSSKELTAAQFADTIGIPRSSISHILSERNRLSMDIARKIVKQYPEITFEWLCDESNNNDSSYSRDPQMLYDQPHRAEFITSQRLSESSKKNGFIPKQDLNNSRVDENGASDTKHVVKMIVFYSDQTWQEFF